MNILITGAWQGAAEYQNQIEQMGHTVTFMQWEKDPLPCDGAAVDAVICNGLFLHHPLTEFPNLKYIQLTSAGTDRVPVEEIKARGIRLCNAGGVYSIPMAEHALWGVLALYHHAQQLADNQKAHGWNRIRSMQELAGKTVCIVGCGSVGSACAKRFAAFDCHVIGVATHARKQEYFTEVLAMTDLKQAISQADVIVLALPLNSETQHIINADVLSNVKKGAILVNIGRGATVDTQALCAKLQDETLGGAVLDVFEEEPLSPEHPLWNMENVIVTPHNSFVGEGNGQRLAQVIVEKLSSFGNQPTV